MLVLVRVDRQRDRQTDRQAETEGEKRTVRQIDIKKRDRQTFKVKEE